jgi:hypothetical protein
VKDLARGPEAYLEMWERASGVPAAHCQPARLRFNSRRLGRLRLGAQWPDVLRAAGQPQSRPRRVWRYCVNAKPNRVAKSARVVAVLTPSGRLAVVASTARQHRRRHIGRGASAKRLHTKKRRGIVVRRASRRSWYVYGIRHGRVRYVALVAKGVKGRRYLRLAGL